MRRVADADDGAESISSVVSGCSERRDSILAELDSALELTRELQKLIVFATRSDVLRTGTASFMRDHIRTLLVVSSANADKAIRLVSEERCSRGVSSELIKPSDGGLFNSLGDSIIQRVMQALDGEDLSRARQVCKRWSSFASDERLWKHLCLSVWRALESDSALWAVIDASIQLSDPARWRKIYPSVRWRKRWTCRLQKTGRFVCDLVAHQISGGPLGEKGLPSTLVVERRFNISHLQTFVLPEASVLYFEPAKDEDRAGYEEFIAYLLRRTRAGLALEDHRRFIFIPPCAYSKQLNYLGPSLLGVVQIAYPPLANQGPEG
uniref:F-box domain-containing protein n=1 Tax=Erythrolobus australicus TaxID=1077150 RepID=A0A7S1XH60_9RHOD